MRCGARCMCLASVDASRLNPHIGREEVCKKVYIRRGSMPEPTPTSYCTTDDKTNDALCLPKILPTIGLKTCFKSC